MFRPVPTLLVAAIASACGGPGGDGGLTAPLPAVATVSLTAPSASLVVGDTVQLSATVRDARGHVLSGRAVAFSSSASTVAAVSALGRAVGVSAGTATITATSEGQTGTLNLSVTLTPVPTIDCTPSTVVAPLGGSVTISCRVRSPSATDTMFSIRELGYQPGVSMAMLGASSARLTPAPATVFVAVNVDSTAAQGQQIGSIVASIGAHAASTPLPVTVLHTRARLRMIYLIPLDGAFDPAVPPAMERAARSLQIWYYQQLGDVTFALHYPVVDVYRSAFTSGSIAQNAFNGVGQEIFAAFGGRYYDPANIWAVYFDVVSTSPTGGNAALATLPHGDVFGLTGRGSGGDPVARWIGGLGHEIGHAFGLPHPPGCDAGQRLLDCGSIMYTGLYAYPNTFLAASQMATLRATTYVEHITPTLVNFDANQLRGLYRVSP